MTTTHSDIEFYDELKSALPKSTTQERKIWASIIIQSEFDIKALSKLLLCKKEIASRFLWLLSEIGEINADKLHQELPFLFELNKTDKPLNFQTSFATFWLIAGVPHENEALAIDLLFGWLQSPNINVTTKSRSLFVLVNLTKKYPALKNELKLCLEDQMDKNTKDFNRRAKKVLDGLAI